MSLSLSSRTVLLHEEESGAAAEKSLDTHTIGPAGLTLTGYTDITPGKRILLAPAADDVEVAFTHACALLIVSRDYPFSLRLAAGETLLTNVRKFELFADDTDDGVLEGPVLLTGNGTNQASLEVWIVELPA